MIPFKDGWAETLDGSKNEKISMGSLKTLDNLQQIQSTILPKILQIAQFSLPTFFSSPPNHSSFQNQKKSLISSNLLVQRERSGK
jgi:uncharacterized Zn-finger protein